MKKILILLSLIIFIISAHSQSKIYKVAGFVNIEKGSEKFAINTSHFDWRKVYTTYKVRDNIQKQEIELGTLANITDSRDSLFGSALALEIFLNGLHSNDVFIQDQTSPILNWALTQKLNTVTLTDTILRGDEEITLTAGHNCTVNEFLEFWENNIHFQVEIASVNVNEIGLFKPIIGMFTPSANIQRCNADINKDGSSTSIDYTFKPIGTLKFDIYSISGEIASSGVPDDGKFAGTTALTNGVLAGKINSYNHYDSWAYNIRQNSCFKLNGFYVNYTDKAPAGTYGTEFQINWKEQHGVNPRINSARQEYIIVRNRDDITETTTGISLFRIFLLGHIVED